MTTTNNHVTTPRFNGFKAGSTCFDPPWPPLPLPPPLLMVCAPLGRPTRHSPTSLDRKLDGNNDDDDDEEEDDDKEEDGKLQCWQIMK